jgi:hypothetical protein
MGRDEQTQTNKKQNKQTNKQIKIPGSRTIEFQSLFKHPVLVLVFKQKLCHSLARWLGSVFFFFLLCLSVAAAWSAPPSVRCGSLLLYVLLRFQRSAL